jgi:hypothetical protein
MSFFDFYFSLDFTVKAIGKVHQEQATKPREGKITYSSILSSTSQLDPHLGGQQHSPAPLTAEKKPEPHFTGD